jgi:prepilin-type N-terminal cleavage/methylation domain-containing protein
MSNKAGFTLVETLAALAIASAIILSTGVLLHQGVFFFDHGTRTVDRSEQLALAVESLTRDFGAARFVLPKNMTKIAFAGSPAGEDSPAKVTFITSGGHAAGPQGEEVVSLTVEQADTFSQLVRHRLPWLGPRMRLEEARPEDSVILLKGKFDISLSFSELTDDGKLIWQDRWSGEKGLPHSVRLNLRDFETGADLLAGAEFPIHANAPSSCATGEVDCLSLAADQKAQPGAAQTGQPR